LIGDGKDFTGLAEVLTGEDGGDLGGLMVEVLTGEDLGGLVEPLGLLTGEDFTALTSLVTLFILLAVFKEVAVALFRALTRALTRALARALARSLLRKKPIVIVGEGQMLSNGATVKAFGEAAISHFLCRLSSFVRPGMMLLGFSNVALAY
jgi:hypothetical protein